MSKKVLVIGPGALGVLVAVRLQNAGHTVAVAARSAASAKALPRRWEAIDAQGVSTTADIPVIRAPKGAGPYDALVLATKCDDAAAALATWLPTLRPDGAVIALQNGILGDALAPIAGDRLVECTVALPATLLGPGRSEQTGPGDFILGAWPDGRMEAATPQQLAADLMVDVAPTRIHQNMLGVKWSKLCLNSAITGLGVLTGQPLGELVDSRPARTALLHVVTEGYRVGTAMGVPFEKIGAFHPKLLAVGHPTKLGLAKRHLLLRIIGRRYRRQRSSSLQSLERGRATEVPHLNGFIVAAASPVDLTAPINAAIVKLVADIEAGKRKPGPALIDELPFRFH